MYLALTQVCRQALAIGHRTDDQEVNMVSRKAAESDESPSCTLERSSGRRWRTLWLAIAGVMAITLTWNVLMLSLNGISY